ncbi:MAG TPA: hypothetical protein VFX30_10185 [bacterium]|nr:hypothetical protein [bacterium]
MAVGIVPAYQSPLVHELFARQSPVALLPNLATSANPANGFDPTRLENGTEVRWVPNPAMMGIPFGARVSALWEHGLGLVAFRNLEKQVVGGIYLHSAIRNPWSQVAEGAFQCLGGIMVFPNEGTGSKNAEDLFADVVSKGEAMCPKWQFHRINAQAEGVLADPRLGGGKSTASHPATEQGKKDAIAVTAAVASALGIYISGSDQNMTAENCGQFASLAPRNFMGVNGHPLALYAGMGDPSPWTAKGVYFAIRAAREKLLNGETEPVFIQGYGNVGRPLTDMLVRDGHPISGIIDTNLAMLIRAREAGLNCPLYFLDTGAGLPDAAALERHNVKVVKNMVEALERHPETTILSPNAGTHLITLDVASYLVNSKVRTIIGAANNMLDVVDGSVEVIANMLQNAKIFVPNDSETNQMGALSVVVRPLGLTEEQLMRLAQGVGARTYEAIELFYQNIAPQIGRARIARRFYNQLLASGEAVGGYYVNAA